MFVLGIIPARMSSSRFPGKPMADIHGVPMVGHCYFRSLQASILDDLYVACCDQEVYDYVTSVGGKAIMTADTHEMCNDRVAEATETAEKLLGHRVDIVANIQGDQPMVFPEQINDVVQLLIDDPEAVCSTSMEPITDLSDMEDPNRVKLVTDLKGNLLYITRAPVPSLKKYKGKQAPLYRHVALYPFRRDYLLQLTKMPMTPLETVESIDLIRVLEDGRRVKTVVTNIRTETVDTQADLELVRSLMPSDRLFSSYREKAVGRTATAPRA